MSLLRHFFEGSGNYNFLLLHSIDSSQPRCAYVCMAGHSMTYYGGTGGLSNLSTRMSDIRGWRSRSGYAITMFGVHVFRTTVQRIYCHTFNFIRRRARQTFPGASVAEAPKPTALWNHIWAVNGATAGFKFSERTAL